MDEKLSAARKNASTPREKYELAILEARSGNIGLVYVCDDERANAEAAAGHHLTMKLEAGDVILIEKIYSNPTPKQAIIGAFLGVLIDAGKWKALVIDKLDSNISNYNNGQVDLTKNDRLVVWFRQGKPA